jgi:hypothetical protein
VEREALRDGERRLNHQPSGSLDAGRAIVPM